MGAVLDTNVVIEIAVGNKEVLDKVLSVDNEFYLTTISRFELLSGNLTDRERFWIDQLVSLPLDDDSSELAATLFKSLKKEGRMISLRDLFIGAICMSNGLPLITLDADFLALQDHGLELYLLRDQR